LVFQDEVDLSYGQYIVLPDKQATERRPTIGTVIQVGDGFIPHEWINYYDAVPEDEGNRKRTTEAWKKICPVKVGDRVLWSRYEDMLISLPVHPDWWSEKEIENMKKLKREKEEQFVVLDIAQIAIVLTDTPDRKKVWEE
jgi:co-chaperonin GroES (HSP10)